MQTLLNKLSCTKRNYLVFNIMIIIVVIWSDAIELRRRGFLLKKDNLSRWLVYVAAFVRRRSQWSSQCLWKKVPNKSCKSTEVPVGDPLHVAQPPSELWPMESVGAWRQWERRPLCLLLSCEVCSQVVRRFGLLRSHSENIRLFEWPVLWQTLSGQCCNFIYDFNNNDC